MENWLQYVRDAEKTALLDGSVKKVHYKFSDGRQMAEEYNMDTQVVMRRAWKISKTFGSSPEWEIEIGDSTSVPQVPIENIGILETNTAPCLSKRLTKSCIEWRIRNLPYPIDVYTVTADNEERCITIRTSNKKFFKKLPVPDLDRLMLPIESEKITTSHKHNTLIISYKKPPEMVTVERLILEEINKVNVPEIPKEGPLQCPTS